MTKVSFQQIKNKTLSALDDVNIPSPSDGHVLTYDAQTHKWVPQAIQGGGNNVLFVELTEENGEWSCNQTVAAITGAMAEGKMVYGILTFYGNIVVPIVLYYADNISRVAIFELHVGNNWAQITGTSEVEDDEWTTDQWEYEDGRTGLDDLADVNASSPLNGQGLVWDGLNQAWVPGNISGGGGGGAAVFNVTDDGQGNITLALANTSSTLGLTDDGNGNITLTIS